MIRLHVSAVLAVYDGFTGSAISRSTVTCFLDGARYMPEYREGGYFVFVNVPPGEHRVELRSARYEPEFVTLNIRQDETAEYGVTLKPAPHYPFGGAATSLIVRFSNKRKPVSGRTVWLAARAAGEEFKLAQDQAEAGVTEARIFSRGGRAAYARNFLIADGKGSEVVFISDIRDSQAVFAEPLERGHKRGAAFYPAQAFVTGAQGEIMAFFREPLPIEIFDPVGMKLISAELIAGVNRLEAEV